MNTAESLRCIATWVRAAHEYRHRRGALVAQVFVPAHLHGDALYGHTFALAVTGAVLCANLVAQVNGHDVGQPPPGHRYEVAPGDPRREQTARDRIAAQVITAAANGRQQEVIELIAAWAPPASGLKRMVELLLTLMATYVAAVPAGGAR